MKKLIILLIVILIISSIGVKDNLIAKTHAYDVAERFSTFENLEAGDVVVLSETKIDEKIASEALKLDEKEVKDAMKELGIEDANKLNEIVDNNLNNKNGIQDAKQKIINKLNEKDPELKTSIGKDKLLAAKAALVKTTTTQNDPNIVGVVSSNPSFVMGYGSELKDTNSVPVALVGRVPVKVSLENGAINIGDALTSSAKKGYAAKTIKPGRIIGYAMEDYKQESNNDKILVFVQPGNYNNEGNSYQSNYLNKINGSVIIKLG